jgi:hypothetical protein
MRWIKQGASALAALGVLVSLALGSGMAQREQEVNLPDLVIENVFSKPISPAVGERVTFNVLIRNAGDADVTTEFNLSLGIPSLELRYVISVKELKAGDQTLLTVGDNENITFEKAGTYEVSVWVDVFETIPEKSELNNFDQIDLQISPPPPSLPDLIVENIIIASDPPHVGIQPVEIVIKNIGSVSASMGGSRTSFSCVTPTGFTFTYLDINIPAVVIPPGETYVKKLSSQDFSDQGSYNISAHVDHEDVINEANENNNLFVKQLSFGPPQIEVNRSGPGAMFEGASCTIQLSIDPQVTVNGLIVIERLPTSPWLFTASGFSIPPNLYDENNGLIKWLFMSQTAVGAAQITYTLHVPENAGGSYGIAHKLEGDWKILGAHGYTQGLQQLPVKNMPTSVSDEELLDYIDQWAAGQLSSEEILLLIEVWAGG